MNNQVLVKQANFKERLAKVRSFVCENSEALEKIKCNINFNPSAWKKMGLSRWNRGGN